MRPIISDLIYIRPPVTTLKYPLRVNVGFLIHQTIGTSRDVQFEFPQLQLNDLGLSQFKGVARFSRTPQGILAQGDFEGQTTVECVRCLTEFLQPLHTTFSELFAFHNKALTDSGLILPEDGNIDLGPLAREYLLLEVPIRPLCREDCRGLCMECGADLNQGLCEHQAAKSAQA